MPNRETINPNTIKVYIYLSAIITFGLAQTPCWYTHMLRVYVRIQWYDYFWCWHVRDAMLMFLTHFTELS